MLLTAVTPRWELFREGNALYQEIVENAIVVTGARFVNLSWYDPASKEITGAAWSIRPRSMMDDAMRAAQAVVPGINPLHVRFSGDVNPAVHTVLVRGSALLAPFTEHVAGTVHPALARIAQTMMGLRWTHAVPLRIGSSVVGSLAYHYLDRPVPETLTVAEAFAQEAALTLENARLSDALRARARDIESSRERIAVAEERVRREIADLLQSRVETRILVATQRILECRELARADASRAAAALAEVADELDRIRDEDVRRASHRLHPSAIAIGLLPALELLAEGLSPRLDVRLTVSPRAAELDDVARNALPERLRLSVYRFVEEALGNAARHAGTPAAEVDVDVEEPASLRVRVSDRGRGFERARAREGMGLRSMQDHVERLGGTLRVMTAPGAGTTVEAVVPVSGPGHGERRRWPRRETGPPASGNGTDALVQRIVENALAVVGARFVSLSWYEPSQQMHTLGAVAPLPLFARLLAAARAVVPGFDPAGIRFSADINPATRRVLIEGRPLLAPLTEHAVGAIPPAVLKVAGVVLGVRWAHSVPLFIGGAVAGALAFHFAAEPPAEKLPIAEAYAKQVALTLENVRLSDALRERAEELARSRERIAAAEDRAKREIAELLHGQVQTRLLVATHRLWEVRSLLDRDPAAADAVLVQLATELDRIREEDVRQASRQLHPPALVVGLVAALQQLAESLGPRLDVSVEAVDAVTVLDDPRRNRIPEAIRLGIYRFVEEALANAARHAEATAAEVRVDLDETGRLRATVVDHGRGFDPATVRAGVGLSSMRDRAERLGGTLAVGSSRGEGTTVAVALPLVLA